MAKFVTVAAVLSHEHKLRLRTGVHHSQARLPKHRPMGKPTFHNAATVHQCNQAYSETQGLLC